MTGFTPKPDSSVTYNPERTERIISSGDVVPGLRKKFVVLANGASENDRLALPVGGRATPGTPGVGESSMALNQGESSQPFDPFGGGYPVPPLPGQKVPDLEPAAVTLSATAAGSDGRASGETRSTDRAGQEDSRG